MTRMTKKIHLALVGTALSLPGCGQKQPPPAPPARVQDGDWGGPRREAAPPVIVNGALLGTTHLIVQNFGAQAIAPGGFPLGTLTQAVCAAGLTEENLFPNLVFVEGNPDEWQGGVGVLADHQTGQQGTRHTTTHHHRSGPGFIIIGGMGGGYRTGPPVVGNRATTTTGRPSGTSMPGSSGSSATSRGGFGSTGGSISSGSSS